jgi:hypothetical protein
MESGDGDDDGWQRRAGQAQAPRRSHLTVSDGRTGGCGSAPSSGSVGVPLSAAAAANVVAPTECADFNSDADVDPSDPVDAAASASGSDSDSAPLADALQAMTSSS